jgi:photosystem II stability/assembly factor-like uncharacterized protein
MVNPWSKTSGSGGTKAARAMLLATLLLAATWAKAQNRPRRASIEAPSPLHSLEFRNLGPAVAGGRVTAVVGVSGKPNLYYAGTAAGGVFKTTDGGVSWTALFQHEPVSTVGALALAPSNPNLVWLGTGEANIRNDIATGRGVYFSPDGGRNWRYMGLGDAGQISSILVSPLDPNVVFVGVLGHAWGPNAERGVFRTTDGGKTWKKVLYVNATTGVADLVMEPGNPKILYAGMWQVERRPWVLESGGPGSGIYRTTDGGDTWHKLSAGLPKEPVGRIGLAVAPSDPAHVYALVSAKEGVLWDSRDRGEHWTIVSRNRNLDARPFYFSHVYVSPDNEEKLYFLSFYILESTDGGRTARVIARGVHADHHSLWIDPHNGERMIEGNDGGPYVSTNGARTWRHLDNIPTEQIYSVSIDPNETPYGMCAGLQDNSAWCGPSSSVSRGSITGAEWFTVAYGDGQYAVPAPGTPFIYADSQNGVIQRLNRKTGETAALRPYVPGVGDQPAAELKYRFNWTSPIAVAPNDSKVIYLGGNVLFRSTDAGLHWTAISPDLTRNDKTKQQPTGGPVILDQSGAETYDAILSMDISAVDPKVIWVGTDDGLVQMTSDGGRHWQNVTADIPKLPEWGRISQIEASPFAAGTAFVAVDFHEMENNRPYVFRTDDYGKTWTNITGNLPEDAPVHVVREDPNRRGLLVAGTDTGLYWKIDNQAWQPIRSGFPTTPVYDLKFVKPTHDLVVATHGRGLFVLDNLTPLELASGTASAGVKLFPPLAAVRWALFNRHPIRLASFAAPNPPQGAVIDYFLDRDYDAEDGTAAAVKITITDAAGHEVRTLEAPAGHGFHRLVWNLHYDPPLPLSGEAGPRGGGFFGGFGEPPVAPGQYQVTLSAGSEKQSATLQVAADPRTQAAAADFRVQTKAALEAREMVSTVNREINRIDALRQQLETLEEVLVAHQKDDAYRPLLEQALQLEEKLDALEDPIYNRAAIGDSKGYLHYFSRLHDRVTRLLGAIGAGYAQAPSDATLEQMAKLKKEVAASEQTFRTFVSRDLAEFNRAAAGNHIGPLFVPGMR